ncbi:MAG TPA: hypothetical protein VIL47_02870 [Candidatus Bipolaricaulota bacterium]
MKRLVAVDSLFFSWSQSFLFLSGLVLVAVLPGSLPIRAAATTPSMAAFFPYFTSVLLCIYATNFGQVHGDPQRLWRLQYSKRLGPYLISLVLRVSLLLALTLPLWVVFFELFHLRWTAWLSLVYLWLQAQVWGGFGLWLSLTPYADITQFKIKYVLLIAYFGLTLFTPPFNPFFTLQVLLDPNSEIGASAVHLLLGLTGALGCMALTGFAAVRQWRKVDAL